MDFDRLLNVVGNLGKMMIEYGAEIYRVEDTMVHLCRSFEEVDDAESFVIPTGIMMSIHARGNTYTKILRVHAKSVDLDIIDQINSLSRAAFEHPFTIEELESYANKIQNKKKYGVWTQILGGCFSAFGFALFYDGSLLEAFCTFWVAFGIKGISIILEHYQMHAFFVQMVGGATSALLSTIFATYIPHVSRDILIISSIMLLVPGLAITNAIRDTMHTDYLSGVSRTIEALLSAVAIAVGVGVILQLTIGGNI